MLPCPVNVGTARESRSISERFDLSTGETRLFGPIGSVGSPYAAAQDFGDFVEPLGGGHAIGVGWGDSLADRGGDD